MIRIFNSNDKLYDTNGNVVLKPTYANVHKEDNGAYYLDIETNLQNEVIKHIEAQAGTNIEINSSATLTDVDATKEAELTALKGQTTQATTPTPSTPQPINVVSGEQDINVCGKNLLAITPPTASDQKKGITTTYDSTTGKISFSGTTTSSYPWLSNANIGIIPSGTQLVFSINTTKTYKVYARLYSSDNTYTTLTLNNATSVTGTTSKDVNRIVIMTDSASGVTLNDEIYLQIEKGSSVTEYEAYTGNTYEINLPIENKFNFNTITSVVPSDSTYSDNVMTTSTIASGTGHIRLNFTSIPLAIGDYYVSADIRLVSGTGTFAKINDGNSDKTAITNPSVTNDFQRYVYKFSYSSATNLGSIYIQFANCSNAIVEIRNIQVSTINSSYTPYGTTPIELCKIGTYQDKIYKDNGIWYLHKEIGKVVLNGSETFGYNDSGVTGIKMITFYRSDLANKSGNYLEGLSNYFTNKMTGKEANTIRFGANNTNIYFYINASDYASANDFKTWLSTHNTSIYYVLATPTNTPIEDSELLEQLESIELLNGVNNISVTSSDLPTLLDLHYNYVTGGDVTTGDYLQPNNILVANTPTGNQAFRITSIEKTRHKIKIKANHVFYDSMNYVIQDSYVVDKNLNDALDHLNNATDNTSPFTTLSNVTTINSYRCVRKSLYEAVNVLLERWGGHLVRDNFNLKIMDAIGQDNGVTVRYGKNLKDITVDYNWDNVVTKILPVGYDGLLLDEIYIYADIQYDIPYTKVVHFEQDLDINDYKDEDGNVDEEAYQNALKADLRSQAHEYLQQNSIPKVNYELQANLEKITDVGDIIEVIDERLGVNIMTSLISYDYDCILEKYTTLEFGNFQKKLNDLTSYIETQSSEVATEISNETKVTLQTELAQATSQLWGVLGNSYVIYEGDKILVVDSLPKESATNVLMINSGGIGFSNTGINGTFSSAWTIDGTLNMENINVINLTADLIKGGTLKLGSNINQNGILEVYDEANNLIAQLTKDGLRMNATDGGYLLINTTVGFSGYDRNDNRIYWVDGDEFHMKKSVVEEEITLVDKMRIIPITITENNVIINDGIGFVSTL